MLEIVLKVVKGEIEVALNLKIWWVGNDEICAMVGQFIAQKVEVIYYV